MQVHVTSLAPHRGVAASDEPSRERARRERGSSVVEYVGLGALSTMLVSALATAADSAAGDRLGAAIVERLLTAVAGG